MTKTTVTSEDLKYKLSKIRRVFDLNYVENLQPDNNYVQKYYKTNKLTYSLFHTFSDRMYMGVSRDGIYKHEDLLEAARFVEKYILKLSAKHLLELATGRGATSAYLAKKFPEITFEGIDLSPGQLDFAFKRAKKFPNYHPMLGDYHNLSRFKANTFDIVFEIEAVCYSRDKRKVFKEARRALRKGGVFILFDGYLRKKRSTLDKEELLAIKVTEKGMAVSEFEVYSQVLEEAKKTDFKIIYSEDVSEFIMPTLRKFENLAKRFFNHPMFANVITKLLPETFTFNAISGYLMPNLIDLDVSCYCITVLERR